MEIKQIKGTDSLSSSRLTINSNFDVLSTELSKAAKLLSSGTFENLTSKSGLKVGNDFVANSDGLSVNKINVSDELNLEKLLINKINKITIQDTNSSNNQIDLTKASIHLISSSNIFDKDFTFSGSGTNGVKYAIISDGPTVILNNVFVGYSSVKVKTGGSIEFIVADNKKFVVSNNSKVELA